MIELEKRDDGTAVLQIVGDADVYGVETIIEPTSEVKVNAGASTAQSTSERMGLAFSPICIRSVLQSLDLTMGLGILRLTGIVPGGPIGWGFMVSLLDTVQTILCALLQAPHRLRIRDLSSLSNNFCDRVQQKLFTDP
ncbi:MAG: hypothetical protein WDO15_22100 [Bacteroidota bacterium]